MPFPTRNVSLGTQPQLASKCVPVPLTDPAEPVNKPDMVKGGLLKLLKLKILKAETLGSIETLSLMVNFHGNVHVERSHPGKVRLICGRWSQSRCHSAQFLQLIERHEIVRDQHLARGRSLVRDVCVVLANERVDVRSIRATPELSEVSSRHRVTKRFHLP